jgi:hypothetical protein
MCSGSGAEVGFSERKVRLDGTGVHEQTLARVGQSQGLGRARAVDELSSHDSLEGCELLADGRL